MKSLVKVLMVLALGAVICLPGIANALYIETFDSNGANWQDFANDFTTSVAATYNNSGGNPGGYISGSVGNTSPLLYSMFPGFADSTVAKFGDLTGASLTTDFKMSGTLSTSTPWVRFYIGNYTGSQNYFVTKDAYSLDPTSATSWTTYQVSMDASKWDAWGGLNAGTITFADMLSQYNDIGLIFQSDSVFDTAHLGFSSTDGATVMVDNFGSVPLPPSVLLLGSGLLGLVGLGWRRRKTND